MVKTTIPVILSIPADVLRAERLLTISRIGCRTCIESLDGSMAPSHSRMYLYELRDGYIGMSNSGCDSNSLRYDPEKGELVGHSHCTCDACF